MIRKQTLSILKRHASILPTAGIDLERSLIGVDGEGDTGPGAGELGYGWGAGG